MLIAGSIIAGQAARAAERYHPLTPVTLGPWWGSGCPKFGRCACEPGISTLADEFSCQMRKIAEHDLPITVYLFDGSAWSHGDSEGSNRCEGPDCCRWQLGDAPIALLQRTGVRAMLHFWGGCHEASQYQRPLDRLGPSLLGFYLDDGSADEEAKRAIDFMWMARPGDSDVTLKTFQAWPPSTSDDLLARIGNVGFSGDLEYDFAGLREGIRRVFVKAHLMPAPFNEFTAYSNVDDGAPDEETFTRRLHWGCFQPVMAHTPLGNADPWQHGYSPTFLATYRLYSWLHKELVPYIYSYVFAMHEDPTQPVLRDPSVDRFSVRLGDELFVKLITDRVTSTTVELPAGEWIDYWDDRRLLSGTLADWPVPLGREPVFIRQGAILPLDVERAYAGHGTRESKGSLTLLVYPAGRSSFRHRDERGDWVTFSAEASGDRLTLRADGPSSRPLLVRVARVEQAPRSVALLDGALIVNGEGGDPLPRAGDEGAVNGGAPSWYHDAGARRLIVRWTGTGGAATATAGCGCDLRGSGGGKRARAPGGVAILVAAWLWRRRRCGAAAPDRLFAWLLTAATVIGSGVLGGA